MKLNETTYTLKLNSLNNNTGCTKKQVDLVLYQIQILNFV